MEQDREKIEPEEIIDEQRKFWKNATPEVQEENFEMFINLVGALREEDYYLNILFLNSDINVLKKHNPELVELMSQNKKNILIAKNVWMVLDSEHQKQQVDTLKNMLDELLAQDEDISKIWKATSGEIQSDMLDEVLDKHSDTEKRIDILRGLNIPLSQKNLETFLQSNGVLVDNIDSVYELYQNIFKMNKNVNETIDISMFDSKILGTFNLEKMARLTMDPEIQRRVVSLNKINGFDSIMKSINDDNWIMELDGVLKNAENYPELLKNIQNEELDEKSSQMLVQVFSQKENYFNISTVSDAQKYFDIRKDICQKILNDENLENLSPTIEKYSTEDRKRFAMLELMYGIDIDEAQNLVEKYGKDVDKIDINKYGKTAIALIGIKRILECENITEKYEENKSIIDNELEEIQYTNIADLEANCIDMYSQMYKETLYQPQENDKIEEVEYEGTPIDVYEIQGDFNMFIRADGACNGYDEPENFAEKLSTSRAQYHGNCKSFIGQDSISIANSNGVKFGYSNCNNGTLLMAAPWDIMSNGANANFSTASEKWNLNCGIQYRMPQEMINNTRHSYNEFVFEKLIYDDESQKFKRDEPQYIVYVKEPDIDRESDDKWRVTRKAAGQMNLPIVIIDREKCVQKEWEKVEELQNILLGKSENKDNISEADLIEAIVLKFENNANSVKSSEFLANKYFNFEQRSAMTENIVKHIKSFENVDFNKYQELFNKFRDVVQSEENKTISNTGYAVANSRYGQNFLDALNRKCSEIEVESSKRTLKNIYEEASIEPSDLTSAKKILANEKNKEQDIQMEQGE